MGPMIEPSGALRHCDTRQLTYRFWYGCQRAGRTGADHDDETALAERIGQVGSRSR